MDEKVFSFCPTSGICPMCGQSNSRYVKWTAPNSKDVTETVASGLIYEGAD